MAKNNTPIKEELKKEVCSLNQWLDLDPEAQATINPEDYDPELTEYLATLEQLNTELTTYKKDNEVDLEATKKALTHLFNVEPEISTTYLQVYKIGKRVLARVLKSPKGEIGLTSFGVSKLTPAQLFRLKKAAEFIDITGTHDTMIYKTKKIDWIGYEN